MMDPQDIVNMTNQYRTQQGLPALVMNPTLQKAAEARAKDMALTGQFSHEVATTTGNKDPWQFMASNGYRFRHAGENLAAMFTDAGQTVEGWKKSPTHDQNLKNPNYKEVGVAVVPVKYKGQDTNFVIQFFGTQEDPRSPEAYKRRLNNFKKYAAKKK